MTGAGSDARDVVLGRIRAALGPGAKAPSGPHDVPRDYRHVGEHPPGSEPLLDLLTDRLEDYRATVHRCRREALAATVAAALVAAGAERIAVPHGLDRAWLADWTGTALADAPDAPLDVATLDGLDGVVTACCVAIAETGTLVLDSAPDCGRRAITLVPDYHLVVVRAAQVLQSVPEGIRVLNPMLPLTLVSGPSATSDIELSRVEGVHGPRTLVVVLVA